jgi:hypothetical protein
MTNCKLFIFDINPKTLVGRVAVGMERRLREPANFYPPEYLEDLLAKIGYTVVVPGHGARYTLEAKKHASRRLA